VEHAGAGVREEFGEPVTGGRVRQGETGGEVFGDAGGDLVGGVDGQQ